MKISEIRQQYPQYDELSDKELANALHNKFYPEMPISDFYERVGLAKEGLGAALSKGAESLLSQARTGVSSLLGAPEEAGREGIERGRDISSRYAEQVSLDKVIDTYKKRGILPAAGEALSQIPAALAEQAPNIAATLGSARTGAALGSLAGPVGAVVGGVGGALVPSLLTQFGGNVERQVQEGAPVSRGAAAAAAVPQAALDVAGTFIPLGGRLVSKMTGLPEKLLLAGGANAEKLANETLLKTLTKGTATGFAAEIPTEVAQQMLERAQAGLSLSSPDALKEYGETAYQVGLLAPLGAAGRTFDKGAARQEVAAKEAEEKRKAQLEQMGLDEEAAAKKAAEEAAAEAHKQTPEYAQEFAKQFDDLQAQYTALKMPKPGADATFDQKDAYKETQAKRKELGKQLAEMAPEYRRIKPLIEQQRVAQENADRQTQIQADLEKMKQAPGVQQGLPGFAQTETINPAPPIEEDKNAKALALFQQQKEMRGLLEDNQTRLSEAAAKQDYDALDRTLNERDMLQKEQDKVTSLLKDTGHPIVQEQEAQRIAAKLDKAKADLTNMAGEGIDPVKVRKKREEIKALEKALSEYGGVPTGFAKEDYRPAGGVSESKSSFGARVYKPGAEAIEGQEQDLFALRDEQDRQAAADAERNRMLAPEKNALQRIAERPAGTVGQGQVSTQVDQLVDTLFKKDTPISGRVVLGASTTKLNKVDEIDALRAQLAHADITNNKVRAQEIRKRLDDLGVPETETGGDLDIKDTARAAGIEGRLTPEAMAANRVQRVMQKQIGSFDRLANFVNNVRESNQDVSSERQQALRDVAERVKDTSIGMALTEMQARRAQAGKPPLTTQEQVEAVGKLEQLYTELIERGAGLFEKPVMVGEKAQMRANKVVRGSTEELRRAPLGKRVFNNFSAAIDSLRTQVRDTIDEASGAQATPVERKAPAEPKRVEPDLRTQFQGQERSLDEQFKAALARADEAETKTLEDLQAKYKNLSPEAQDMAREQLRRVETGRDLDMPRQLTDELADLRQAGVSDTGQNELFPGESEKGVTRTTSKRFMNFLDSGEVQKLRLTIAEEAKQAEFQAKRAATIAAKVEDEARKADEFAKKVEAANNKTPLEKARAAFAKVNAADSNVQMAIKTADAIRKQRMGARIRIATMVEQIDSSHRKAQKQLDEIQGLYDYIVQQFLLKPKNTKVSVGLDFYEKELKKAEKRVASTQKALDAAKATQERIIKDQADDTISNSLVREGEKADREYQRAKDRVTEAQAAEVRAQNALEKARLEIPKQPREQTLREMAEAAPVERVTRGYRDTSDPAIQRQVKGLRGIIGKDESAYTKAVETDNMEAAEKIADRIQGHYDKINDILNNAPFKSITPENAAETKAFEEYERAQQAALEADVTRLRMRLDLPSLKLSERKMGAVARTQRGAVVSTIKEPSVAQQEKAAAKAPKSVLEKIAGVRNELQTVENQLEYIKNNPSATKEGKAKQKAAKANATQRKADLRAELKDLSIAQTAAVTESKQTKKEKKQVRTVGKEIVRMDTMDVGTPVGELEAGDTDLNSLFRTATQGGTGMKAAEVTRLVDRIIADWKITPEVVVVDDETGLPQRIQDQAARDNKTGMIPGLYDPKTNTVYMVASNLHTGEDVALTIAHEIAGHFGLREMLGDSYNRAMNNIYNGNETVRNQADAKMKAEPNLSREVAVEEVLAEMAETGVEPTPDTRSALRRIFDTIKNWFSRTFGTKTVSDNAVRQIVANARRYVQKGEGGLGGEVDTSGILYRTVPKYANPDLAAAGDIADKLVAKQKGVIDTIRANSSGLAFETQLVDRFAGFERLSKLMDSLKGSQMMYYLRMYDQRMNFTAQSVGNGALQIVEKKRADGKTEYLIESKKGPSLKGVVDILKDAPAGSPDAANRLFTMFLAAKRAERVGLDKLNFNGRITQADLNKAMKAIEDTPGLKENFERARMEYNDYNKGLISFLAQTGAISKEVATRLSESNDYIPFYRQRGGVAELMIGGENPIRVGSIAEQPYLKELVGGDEPIIDFLTSSVQNTNILTDMGLRNIATKNAVLELVNLDLAKISKAKVSGPDVVKFKVDGEDRFALIDTDQVGIPADILVKGMEGIPTQMPFALRVLGAPARLLRKLVTATPLYAAKQLFRDSLAAPLISGADFTPVMGALREIGGAAKGTLESRGITGGQVFTGTSEDLTNILRDITAGKSNWSSLVSKFEAISMEADALTRRAQYNSYIKQGLSEMEATLMSLESMNFNKRGASPSIHVINSLIPFFNSQIQGLNVLYKALTGKLPFNEKLKIQEKLMTRGMMLAAGTLAYTAMMQDDEAYKNATPEQKYGNWFMRLPGVDEPIRIPIPFEIGYIFKALPEALYNTMVNEHGGEEAVKAFGSIMQNTIPGGSSYGIPQALRPAIEAGLGKSFYTGRDILSAHEKQLLPEDQFRANTTEAAKLVGKVAGVSPIVLEQLVQGYTGTMGLAFLQAVSTGVPKREGPEGAYKRLSEMPVVGGAFQPNDAGAIINRVYDRMGQYKQVEASVNEAINKGDRARAMELINTRGNEYVAAEVADMYTSTMKDLTQMEQAIRASNMTPEVQRKKLDDVRQAKIQFARMVERASDIRSLPRLGETTPR
jgi:hypothetical protein